MHSRRFIEEQPEVIRAALAARGHSFDLDALLVQLEDRKARRAELEELQAKRNAGSKQVGQLFRTGQQEEGQKLRAELQDVQGRNAGFRRQLQPVSSLGKFGT